MRQGKSVARDEAFPCADWCFQDGVDHQGRRAEWRCALPGFREDKWHDFAPSEWDVHMGRTRLRVVDDTFDPDDNPIHPKESNEDGCPGAWYRSPFVVSLIKYERLLTEGGFSENITLTRCKDRLVLEAIQCLEQERLRCRGYEQELRSDAMNG